MRSKRKRRSLDLLDQSKTNKSGVGAALYALIAPALATAPRPTRPWSTRLACRGHRLQTGKGVEGGGRRLCTTSSPTTLGGGPRPWPGAPLTRRPWAAVAARCAVRGAAVKRFYFILGSAVILARAHTHTSVRDQVCVYVTAGGKGQRNSTIHTHCPSVADDRWGERRPHRHAPSKRYCVVGTRGT